MHNERIRQAAKQAGVKLWHVAEALGIGDYALSRWLRHELPEDVQARILKVIDKLKDGAAS